MRKKNGFTLVELLAVIVILAIIMILVIPSVLETMNTARRKSFALYIDKVVTAVQTQYVYDANGGAIQGAGWYVYDIQTDLGLTSTGSYNGYVTVNATDVDNPNYYIALWDKNYEILNHNVTMFKMPTADSSEILRYDKKDVDELSSNLLSCKNAAIKKAGVEESKFACYTRQGYLIKDTPTP